MEFKDSGENRGNPSSENGEIRVYSRLVPGSWELVLRKEFFGIILLPLDFSEKRNRLAH